MIDYEITIEWIEAMGDGTWSWNVSRKAADGRKYVGGGTAFWRWHAKYLAQRIARKHAAGKIPKPDPNRAYTYTVWDR